MSIGMAVIMHGGRAFSGDVALRVVGDVGDGHDGASQPFGCRAVMIAHMLVSGCIGAVGPPFSGRRSRLQLMHSTRAVPGAWLPKIYKSQERAG
jgi:hypothetical protein